ncbi:MAG TPA: DNA ligase D [Anaeromyxobacter sp.]|nr:DNA ligase D [Anaeromyxobacter sp.]
MPRRAPVPAYRPQLATLVPAAPDGAGWIHETKYDGYRIGCAVEDGAVTLWSRRGKDWTAQFPEVAQAARALPVRSALLDGEVAVVLPDGRTSFQALQNAFGGGRRELRYFVFDLLFLDGEDLAALPLRERKRRLEALLARSPGFLRYAAHLDGPGPAILREACRLGLEGVVSKRADDSYRPGRNTGWVKAKCVARQELVIGGFTDPEGARDGLGALLVGHHESGRLRFAGKVGTGFTNASARALRARLEKLERKEPPFDPAPRGWLGRNAHWVEPTLVAEVAFTEWTEDGKIRHPSFQGLREDKLAPEVIRETPRDAGPARAAREQSAPGAPTVAGVAISHHDRVVFPDLGLTKLDLARYYETVAGAMVPHLAGRPLTLVHCPEGLAGACRYMKHSKQWAPAAVRRVRIQEKTKRGEYLVADDVVALVSLAQMGVVELHTWNSTVERLEEPDRIVLDLDPGPAVPFGEVVAGARLVRGALEALGLAAFVKTTGGAGLHVVAPLVPARRWEDCLAFARGLAAVLVRHAPDRFTTAFAKRGRERKILLDYLRNNRTNTSVAAFSVRARPGAPVSVPLAWDELAPGLRPERFTVRTVPRRLASLRQDPWAGSAAAARRLDDTRLAAVTGSGAGPSP